MEETTRSFHYGVMARYRGLAWFLLVPGAAIALVLFPSKTGRAWRLEEYVVLGLCCLGSLGFSIAVNRVNQRRLQSVQISEDAISVGSLPSEVVRLPWEKILSVEPFGQRDPLGLAGGGHSGVRIVSAVGAITIYSTIQRYGELRVLLEQKLQQ